MKKKKIAFVSLTSCEGCQFELLDLGKRFFDFLKLADLRDMGLIEGNELPSEKLDIVFIEGNPIAQEDYNKLIEARRLSKTLVVLGNCGAMGGIPEIKNYGDRKKIILSIFGKNSKIRNPKIREIDNVVKVDFKIPGCPIRGEEFLVLAKSLLEGKNPIIPNEPVCAECPKKGASDCFLAKKELCLGPVVIAGCEAVCPSNGLACRGCRGVLKNENISGFLKTLENFQGREKLEDFLETFGLRDSLKY